MGDRKRETGRERGSCSIFGHVLLMLPSNIVHTMKEVSFVCERKWEREREKEAEREDHALSSVMFCCCCVTVRLTVSGVMMT